MKKQETPDVRLFVRITKKQRKIIKKWSNHKKVSEAQIVRDALEFYDGFYKVESFGSYKPPVKGK